MNLRDNPDSAASDIVAVAFAAFVIVVLCLAASLVAVRP
jgi:hypothetical protein